MTQNHEKGSAWRKWDLHLHTPASYLNNQFGSDWDKFVQDLFRKAIQKRVSAIALTDYFTIDGYKKIKTEYLANDEKMQALFSKDELSYINEMLILPNIEFRIDKFVGSNSINLHVIFSNEFPIVEIEDNFLHELDFVYEGSPQTEDEKHKLKMDNLAKLGRKLKSEHTKFQGQSDVYIGMMSAVVDHSQISRILEGRPSTFKGKYLLGVAADNDLSKIDWDSRDHQTRKVLIQKSDFLFSSNPKTIKWALAEEPYGEGKEKFIQEFKSLKPCIHGSDAHTSEQICHPCIHRGQPDHSCVENPNDCKLRYCWIKADTTFEGLKQIRFEPKLRVRIQEDDPVESETYAKINELTITFPDELIIKDDTGEKTAFCINGSYKLRFSNNLTCIIGGRGSGKSTLAHILYNSWIEHDINKLTEINSPLVRLEIPPNPLKKVSELTNCNVPSQTEFFFQNEIEVAAKSFESMSALVIHRLNKLSSLEGNKTLDGLYENWNKARGVIDELIEAYDQITSLDRDISKVDEQITTLKKQIDVITSDEYKAQQNKIKELSIQTTQFDSFQRDCEKLTKEIDALLAFTIQLDWSEAQGKKLLQTFQQVLRNQKEAFQENNKTYSVQYSKNDFPTQLIQEQNNLKAYLQEKGLSSENVQELTQASRKIQELEEQNRVAQQMKKPFEEIYKEKDAKIKSYNESYSNYKDRFNEVTSILKERLRNLAISNKEISFVLTIDHAKLKDEVVNFIRAALQDDTTVREDVIKSLFFDGSDIDTFVKDKENIRRRLNESTRAEKHRYLIQEIINDDILLERLHLRMLNHTFDIENIRVQTKLGGKLLRNTSFGERCGIVIAIALVAGTNPLVIDQPEDHLDGKFTSDVLVPLLREQKHNRQIILITRDANVVIGGDSELIHILESGDKKTEIVSTTIENKTDRVKYIWILDGGPEAFARREQKYSIKPLRSE